MPGQKRQHYFPQVLQRNFLPKNSSNLWVYDRLKDEFRNQATSQIAVEGHLYTLKDPELESQRFAVEDALGILEAKVGPAFIKLRKQEEISQEEKNLICEYVAFQVFRTPEQLEVIKNTSLLLSKFTYQELARDLATMSDEKFKHRLSQYEAEVGHKLNITQESIRETLRDGRIDAKLAPDQHLGTMVDVATELAIEFSKRQWVILHTKPGVSIIGSDCPIVVRHKDMITSTVRMGAGADDSTTMFAFSQDTALLIKSEKLRTMEHASFSKIGTKILNDQLAIESNRIIFSHSKTLLESLAKRNKLPHWQNKIVYKEELIKKMSQKIIAED